MQDTELYQHILGLKSPWVVKVVHLNVNDQQIDVLSATQTVSGQ